MGWVILIIIILLVFGGAKSGRFLTRATKNTVKTTGKIVDKTIKESGEFVKASVDEMRGGNGSEQDVSYCSNCGAIINTDANFCPTCGSKQDDLEF